MSEQQGAGAIALIGSGEYTAAMAETDRSLLAGLAVAAPRVVVIPTASALEPGMPEQWNARGVRHFTALGVAVTPLPLLTRDDANTPEIVAVLQHADFFYFSGGNPEYLIETMRDTLAWEAILLRHRVGAILAGCSAGAMMLGGATLRVREVAAGGVPRWFVALGVVPSVTVMPHFDRLSSFVGAEVFQRMITTAPAGVALVGVDEDTALIRTITNDGAAHWHVSGSQTVVVYSPDGEQTVYQHGETVMLPR